MEVIGLPWRNYALHLTDNLRSTLLKRLADTQLDVLLQDELTHPSLFRLNETLSSRVRYPIVSIVHHLRASERHPPLLRPVYTWIERRYLQGIDAFICNSQTTRRTVEALLRGFPPHVVAVPSGSHIVGLDPAQIARRIDQEHPLHIVFVGNVIPRKGLHTLLSALARMPSEAARLTIIGDTSADATYVRQLRRQIRTARLEGRVELTGNLADEVRNDRLATADVLAVPSQYEGYGIVYLEGMAHGLPAIGTTAGAASEIITPGVDGFLVAPDDVGALAQHLSGLATDRARLLEMSLAARRRFEAHPTWEDTTARIEDFLKSL